MATVNKNFRIKDGLIVEGTTGTINGNNILTDASTTSSLAEGTRLYYTNERVDDRVANLVQGGTGITVTYDDEGNALGLSADFGEFSTTQIVEGDKLFFTDERAQDAIAAALAAGNHVNITVEYNDAGNAINLTGAITYTDADARNAISGGNGISYDAGTGVISPSLGSGLHILGSDIEIDRSTVDTWYDANGAAATVQGNLDTHTGSTSSVHGVSGNVVGTTDQQVLTNKTINDELYFTNPSTVANDGGIKVNDVSEDLEITAYTANLHLKGQNDVTVTANNGNIVLNPNGAAYVTSVSAGNQIATNAYVDNAVSGLDWKESVNLIAASNMDITADFAGLVIDGHEAFNGFDHNHYRILFKGQTTSAENGIYYLQWDGAAPNANMFAIRATDADSYNELIGAAVFVMEGTQYGQTSWVQSNHYLISFADQSWTQFSGTGSVTAGTGISVNGLEVSVDRTTVDTWYDEVGSASLAETNAKAYTDDLIGDASVDGTVGDTVTDRIATAKSEAISAAQTYADALTTEDVAETPSYLYFTEQRAIDAIEAVVPNFTAIEINSVAKQVASATSVATAGAAIAFSWNPMEYGSAEFLVKISNGAHTEISKILITHDSSTNIAITEYGIVGTNGSLGSISAAPGTGGVTDLVVTTAYNTSDVTVVGTLLS